jgi:hypothetical protein
MFHSPGGVRESLQVTSTLTNNNSCSAFTITETMHTAADAHALSAQRFEHQ